MGQVGQLRHVRSAIPLRTVQRRRDYAREMAAVAIHDLLSDSTDVRERTCEDPHWAAVTPVVKPNPRRRFGYCVFPPRAMAFGIMQWTPLYPFTV